MGRAHWLSLHMIAVGGSGTAAQASPLSASTVNSGCMLAGRNAPAAGARRRGCAQRSERAKTGAVKQKADPAPGSESIQILAVHVFAAAQDLTEELIRPAIELALILARQ